MHQKDTVTILQRMENTYSNFSTVVNLPTGTGKTRIAINFCDESLKKGNAKVLWLADKK